MSYNNYNNGNNGGYNKGNNNYNNNSNNSGVTTPKWTEIGSAWKGTAPSGDETLSIKIKQGFSVTLTSDTKICMFANQFKNINNPADANKPDFRMMVPNDGSVIPVQTIAPKTNAPQNNQAANNGGYNKGNNYSNNGGYNKPNNYAKPAYNSAPAPVKQEKPAYNNYNAPNPQERVDYAPQQPKVHQEVVQQYSEFEDSDLPSF
ncbi:MAG: hypothetical protein ACRCX2_09435 [Paraclostridium sp.]